jgi:hypothetical protein
LLSYVLAAFLIFAMLFNFFTSGRGRFTLDGYDLVWENFEEFCAREKFAAAPALKAAFDYLVLAGFDRLCILRPAAPPPAAGENSNAAAADDAVFVFINKNYSFYLDIICEGGQIKNIELTSQFYDSKIHITGSDESMAGFDSKWVEYRVIERTGCAFGPQAETGPVVEYLHGAIERHIEKIKSAHTDARSPFYATARNYASCRNYVRDIKKINKMYEEIKG